MRKLWNHYEPLDLNQGADEPDIAPVPAPAPSSKKTLGEKLEAFFFRVEEEEAAQKVCADTPPLPYLKRDTRAQQREVHKALEEWKAAAAYFQSVTDPELVDYAVYGMEAAQKRYIYLLRTAGRK